MFRVTTLDFKNIAYTDERLHGVAKQYYKKFKDELTAAGKEELIEVINKHLKEHDKSLSLFSYLTAYSHHLPEIIKSGQIEKLNSVFKEIYEVLIDRRFFVRDVSRSGEETIFFNQWFWDLLNPLAGERKVRVYLRSKDPVRYPNKFDYFKAFSFFNFPAVKKELVSSNTRKVDHTQDFFGKETNLTVSGQLEGELAALALGNIYTFGPTFRAENSNTPRHLAEFWMIEPEMAFADINDNMNIAEEMLKYLVNYALHHCKDDVQFLNDTYDNKLMERLHSVVEKHFARITYTEGVEILKAAHSKKAFEFVPDWGKDLQKEHENHLVEHFGGPVIVTGYPKDIKAFYMKQNDDGKTVRAMDILFPWIGEIIGGSQREDNYDRLYARVKEMHIPEESLWWYLETRKFGSCEHSGFGLGFERLLLFVTGMTNIRDVIPFPRTPKNAEF
jgi:elongation factor P--beta-lysine ligase